MILAQNHRQLLNGSKVLGLFLLVLFFSSCDPLKQAQKTPDNGQPIPEKGNIPPKPDVTVIEPSPKKDTIPQTPTIPTTLYNGLFAPGAVDVAVVLPFLTEKFSAASLKKNPKSEIAFQFYAGMKLALDDASYDNLDLTVSILDNNASESQTLALLTNPAIKEADIIIGPYRKKNVRYMADFAFNHNKVFFSPFAEIDQTIFPTYDSGANKPKGTLFQTYIGLEEYAKSMIDYAIEQYGHTDIYLVARKGKPEQKAIPLLQKHYKNHPKGSASIPLNEIMIEDESLLLEEIDIKSILALKPNAVFIIPIWKDESFVNSIVRKIYVSKAEEGMPSVIGLPQWLQFRNIDLQKLNDLKVIIPSEINQSKNEASLSFQKRFFDQYGVMPDKNAHKGFGLTNYMVHLVKENQKSSGGAVIPPFETLHTAYQLQPVLGEEVMPVDGKDSKPASLYHNTYLNILQMDNFRLIQMN